MLLDRWHVRLRIMLRGLGLLTSFLTLPVFGTSVRLLPMLPSGAVSTTVQLDSAGNIYAAGYTKLASAQDAFVAKLSPDGSKVIYFTTLAGSQQDQATGLALAADGSAYITGNTQSSDFPTTAGSLQAANPAPGQLQGFVAKLNPAGAVTYATYVPSLLVTQMTGIALGSAGEVFVTGIGRQSNTPADVSSPGFILKLDPALSRVLIMVYGTGGGLLQLDSQGNIYVAGSAQPNYSSSGTTPIYSLPTFSANAFQPTLQPTTYLRFGSGRHRSLVLFPLPIRRKTQSRRHGALGNLCHGDLRRNRSRNGCGCRGQRDGRGHHQLGRLSGYSGRIPDGVHSGGAAPAATAREYV